MWNAFRNEIGDQDRARRASKAPSVGGLPRPSFRLSVLNLSVELRAAIRSRLVENGNEKSMEPAIIGRWTGGLLHFQSD